MPEIYQNVYVNNALSSAEFTVTVVTRRGKRIIYVHILIDFRHLLVFDHVTSAYA